MLSAICNVSGLAGEMGKCLSVLVSLQFCASIAGVFLLIGLALSGSAAEAEEPVRSSAEILRCGEAGYCFSS